MSRFKRKLRTTHNTEYFLRFTDDVVIFVNGATGDWMHRNFQATHEMMQDIDVALFRCTESLRFWGSTSLGNHFRMVVRFSYLLATSAEAEVAKRQMDVYPTRVWIEHRIGSWQTHWYLLEYQDSELKEIRHRMKSHE